MIAGIDLGGTQVRLALARSDGRITWGQVAPAMEQVLRASPFIRPVRRPRLRRGRLGDRAGQVGAVEWARTHL